MKHTPGPWSVPYDLPWIFNTQNHPWRMIAKCCDWDDEGIPPLPKEEHRANARLIAAAPELLDALQNVLADACENCPFGESECDARDGTVCGNLRIARAAIAKATGEDNAR